MVSPFLLGRPMEGNNFSHTSTSARKLNPYMKQEDYGQQFKNKKLTLKSKHQLFSGSMLVCKYREGTGHCHPNPPPSA